MKDRYWGLISLERVCGMDMGATASLSPHTIWIGKRKKCCLVCCLRELQLSLVPTIWWNVLSLDRSPLISLRAPLIGLRRKCEATGLAVAAKIESLAVGSKLLLVCWSQPAARES